jgi:hypothetical protein
MFEQSLLKFANRDCLGRRSPLADKKWSQYTFESYATVGQRRIDFGSGLINLCEMQPKDPLGIYSKTNETSP